MEKTSAMSRRAFSDWHAPSTDHMSRLSQRLRSGAMAMSRSALTHADMLDDVVDVGEGVVANFFEHLLARLEQHGVRRCFVNEGEDEDDTKKDGAGVMEDQSTNKSLHSSSGQRAGDERQPYYYMCVPCELHLTDVSRSAATLAMLQDAHYHCSSAQHRRIASWMGEADIDCTLQTSSRMDPTAYARIYVNGIPVLVSSRPGGGDMFFPLPHEMQEPTVPLGMDGLLGVTQPEREIWNSPLRSIYTGTKQLLYSVDKSRRTRTSVEKSLVRKHDGHVVLHIPEAEYRAESFVEGATVPAIFEVTRERLPKDSEDTTDEAAYRVGYVVSERPLMIWSDDMKSEPSRITVRHDGVYRVALLDAKTATDMMSRESLCGPTEAHGDEGTCSQVLTVEALNRLSMAAGMHQNFSRGDSSVVSSSNAPVQFNPSYASS